MSTPGPNSAGPAAVKSAGSTNLIDVVIEDADADSDGLKRTIGPLNLTSIGTMAVWIFGWDLLVEYLFGTANVARG